MSKIAAVALLAFMVSGCTPSIVNKPIPIDMPVEVKCSVPSVSKPVWAVDAVQPGASMWVKVKALLVDERQHQAYEASLQAANASCQ